MNEIIQFRDQNIDTLKMGQNCANMNILAVIYMLLDNKYTKIIS